jgi:hypothetical protein
MSPFQGYYRCTFNRWAMPIAGGCRPFGAISLVSVPGFNIDGPEGDEYTNKDVALFMSTINLRRVFSPKVLSSEPQKTLDLRLSTIDLTREPFVLLKNINHQGVPSINGTPTLMVKKPHAIQPCKSACLPGDAISCVSAKKRLQRCHYCFFQLSWWVLAMTGI